jgi:hypothetical protein
LIIRDRSSKIFSGFSEASGFGLSLRKGTPNEKIRHLLHVIGIA